MEKLDWQRSEEQDNVVANVDIERDRGRECDIPRENAWGKRERVSERKSMGRRNDMIGTQIVGQNRKAKKILMDIEGVCERD